MDLGRSITAVGVQDRKRDDEAGERLAVAYLSQG
jgi:hypothetical protein